MSTRVRSLVLAQLGLVLACKKTESVVDASSTHVVLPEATLTAPPSIAPSTTVASSTPSSSSSVKPVVTIPLTVNSKPPLQPGRCWTNADCSGASGVYCTMPQNPSEPGYCRSVSIMRGRPLVVDGRARFASIDRADGTWWEDAAREEHASIAAFARTICELMALGAPLDLLRKTQSALADEIRHAELVLEVIERATGRRPELGPLPEAAAPIARSNEDFFRDVFRGGAIGETLAAARAEREIDDADLRETIVTDEARHAALAFETLIWLLARFPALAVVRDEEIARFFATASHEERALVGPLFEVLAQ